MKAALLLSALLLILAPSAHAWEPDPWTAEQVALEATFATLVYVDWRQTSQAISRERVEENPHLGPRPSEATLVQYFAAVAVLHAAISAVLPDAWRLRWQYVTVGYQGHVVQYNWQVGLTMGF